MVRECDLTPSGPLDQANLLYSDEDAIAVPDVFKCPITKSLMKDPVLGPDGYTYDREAITNLYR